MFTPMIPPRAGFIRYDGQFRPAVFTAYTPSTFQAIVVDSEGRAHRVIVHKDSNDHRFLES